MPQQNGVAEQKNRHIAKISHALMSKKEMPQSFWAEVVHTAIYIMNRTLTMAIHDITLEKQLIGRKPDVSHLKVFGFTAYVYVPDELRTKVDPKVEKCIFVGYSLEPKGYHCYNPNTHEIWVRKDMVFDELRSWYEAPKCMNIESRNNHVVIKALQ